MPQPTRTDVHIDRALTNISIGYMNEAGDYISSKVFPTVPVTNQSDKYFTYGKHAWFRDEAKKRAPATESAGGGYDISTATYTAEEVAFHKDVADEMVENQDSPIDSLTDATTFVTDKLMLHKEADFVNSFFTPSVWGVDYTGVASSPGAQQCIQWDQANSKPIQDVTKMKQRVARVTGKVPNTMVISALALEALKQNDDIIGRYKYTQAGVITAELIAKVFELQNIYVANAIVSTDPEGAASPTYDYIFGRNMLLLYAQNPPALIKPSAGYSFIYTKHGMLLTIRKFYMEEIKATRVEGSMYYCQKKIASDLGIFCSGIISTGFAS